MKVFYLIAALTQGVVVFASNDLPDLSRFEDMTTEKFTKPVLVESFDNPLDGWDLSDHFRVEKSEGTNGSAALCYTRNDPAAETRAYKMFIVDPGITYRLSMDYRSELKVDPRRDIMEIFAVRYLKNGKPVTGSFHMIPKRQNTPEWEKMSMVFQPDKGMTEAMLDLLMRTGRTGKIWYDNIVIEPLERTAGFIYLTEPKKLSLDPEGRIAYKVTLNDLKSSAESLAVLVNVNGREKMLSIKDGMASCAMGEFPEGELDSTALLLDMKRKAILAKVKSKLFRRNDAPGPGNVTFDKDGTTLIDGKPFLPIGIYAGFDGSKDTEALKRIADAGFNCVLSVGTASDCYFAGEKKTMKATLEASLDELAKYNLKYIFALKHQINAPQRGFRLENFDGITGLENVNREIINTVKNHPALLAWYVSDENPISEMAAIANLREQLARLDPKHPTVTLTEKVKDMAHFAGTGDIFAHDAYPIGLNSFKTGPDQTMENCQKFLLAANELRLPVWWVPQIFAWGSFRSSDLVQRYPTAEEIRSMILQGTVRGVKGYLLYAYHPIFYLSEKRDPGKSMMQWNNVTPSVKMLNELAPFILSKDLPPEVTVKQISGKLIEARAFKHNGQVRVVITALGPGESEAIITVKGQSGLKPIYGRTTETGDGKYNFKGLHISSDILQ